MAEITNQQRKQARDKIAELATTDPSAAVRARCSEYVAIWVRANRGDLLTTLRTVALNTSASDANRLRAIDLIVRLVDDLT